MRRWTQATLEKEALKAFAPAYVLKEPKTLKTPLIFASPHSGAKYPKPFLSMSGRTLNEFGRALIVDCHSMPGFAPLGARRADIVLGDRYAQSCWIMQLHIQTLSRPSKHKQSPFITVPV